MQERIKKIVIWMLCLSVAMGFMFIEQKSENVKGENVAKAYPISRVVKYDLAHVLEKNFTIKSGKPNVNIKVDNTEYKSGKTYYLYKKYIATDNTIYYAKVFSFKYSSFGKTLSISSLKYGYKYQFIITDENASSKDIIKEYFDVYGDDFIVKIDIPTENELGDQLVNKKGVSLVQKSSSFNKATVSFKAPSSSTLYYGTKRKKVSRYKSNCVLTGLKPSTTYDVKVKTYVSIGTHKFYGRVVFDKAIYTTKLKPVTKLKVFRLKKNSRKVKVSFKVPKEQRINRSTKFYIYANKKLVKVITNNGIKKYSVIVKRKNIAKKKIYVSTKCVNGGKAAKSKKIKKKKIVKKL